MRVAEIPMRHSQERYRPCRADGTAIFPLLCYTNPLKKPTRVLLLTPESTQCGPLLQSQLRPRVTAAPHRTPLAKELLAGTPGDADGLATVDTFPLPPQKSHVWGKNYFRVYFFF